MRNDRNVVSGVSLVLVLALAGCMDGTGGTTGPTSEGGRAEQAVERDVEAPNVFSKRDSALWDGRPSLGGVWVAHPDVRTPERVIIRNSETGRETIGALFRRERMNPGPVFQVSADAAAAVGMLAGAPTGIEVIALRTEEIAPAPAEAAAADTPETQVAATAADTPVTPIPATIQTAAQVASAPVAAPVAATAQAAIATADASAAAAETMIAMPDADAAAPRRGFFSRLFGRDATQTAAADGAQIETQVLADASGTAPLSALAVPPESAAPTAPLPMPTPLGTAAAAPSPAPVAQAAASTLAQPFVQLGIFSVEANAKRAQSLAQNAGLSARVVQGQTQGNNFWRVTVGPATTTAEQRDLLARVKALGFKDAYTVRR